MRLPLCTVLSATVIALALARPANASRFEDAFWKYWGDGQAEVATYDLTYSRYGEPRAGLAVAIFVTETFSEESRVKADPGKHDAADEFPVMKLNLVQDFPTGIYDYQLMTSTFVGLAEHGGRPEGAVAKVSFSSQEWCGQVWHELLPDAKSVRHTSHSYFDGEGDQSGTLPYPEGGLLEDAVLLWARGFAAPFLAPGETREIPVLRSTEVARLQHFPVEWENAVLSRAGAPSLIDVPAGSFEVEAYSMELDSGRSWDIFVETREPRRVVRWTTSDGTRAELVRAQRLRYWRMNGPEFVDSLALIGLSPRPPRTP
jgi:hypothetical protein